MTVGSALAADLLRPVLGVIRGVVLLKCVAAHAGPYRDVFLLFDAVSGDTEIEELQTSLQTFQCDLCFSEIDLQDGRAVRKLEQGFDILNRVLV